MNIDTNKKCLWNIVIILHNITVFDKINSALVQSLSSHFKSESTTVQILHSVTCQRKLPACQLPRWVAAWISRWGQPTFPLYHLMQEWCGLWDLMESCAAGQVTPAQISSIKLEWHLKCCAEHMNERLWSCEIFFSILDVVEPRVLFAICWRVDIKHYIKMTAF